MDKSYYDYDYEKPSDGWRFRQQAAKSNGELKDKLQRLGLGVKRTPTTTAEQVQQAALKRMHGQDV